jgi:hypothetical protein
LINFIVQICFKQVLDICPFVRCFILESTERMAVKFGIWHSTLKLLGRI